MVTLMELDLEDTVLNWALLSVSLHEEEVQISSERNPALGFLKRGAIKVDWEW